MSRPERYLDAPEEPAGPLRRRRPSGTPVRTPVSSAPADVGEGAEVACFATLRRQLKQLFDDSHAGEGDATPPEVLAMRAARYIDRAVATESAEVADAVTARAVLWVVLEHEGRGSARARPSRSP